MSNPGDADDRIITDERELAAYFAAGAKPASEFAIGTEHEAFGFRLNGYAPPGYDEASGIRDLLMGIEQVEGLSPILDQGNVIGLKGGGASLSLEPGGQFELSGAILRDLHATKAELDRHVARVRAVAPGLGLGFAPLGFHPIARRADMPFMPKGRYKIMRDYMPKVGTRGMDMMLRTCTVQVNLDFSSEADMVAKMRVGAALQPLATALFANSPFYEGRPNGLLSNRAQVWTDTDNTRSGIPRLIFENGFGFEAYAQWLLDVPMYFVYRDGVFHDVSGASFRRFMSDGLQGMRATMGDFADHATTAFPDVRLKRYIETRGADSGRLDMMLAQSAFWTGIFYDPAALAAAAALVRGMAYEDVLALRAAVPVSGINTVFGRGTLRDLGREAVAIARDGLRARGLDEEGYLAPLDEIAGGGLTQAEVWLERYYGAWREDVKKIFAEASL